MLMVFHTATSYQQAYRDYTLLHFTPKGVGVLEDVLICPAETKLDWSTPSSIREIN
jgi:hypothetical protein